MSRGFGPGGRFYAEDAGQVVGYCTLEPDQGRISYPWCKKGFEAVGPQLFEAAIATGRLDDALAEAQRLLKSTVARIIMARQQFDTALAVGHGRRERIDRTDIHAIAVEAATAKAAPAPPMSRSRREGDSGCC